MANKGSIRNPQAMAIKEEILEVLGTLGDVSARSMFGGYGIFEGADMFTIIDTTASVYFKADAQTRSRYEKFGSAQHRPIPYFAVPADILENEQSLIELAAEAIAVAHSALKK